MDFLSKIKEIKSIIKEWQKKHGNEFNYVAQIIYRANELEDIEGIDISKNEHIDIVKYLETKGFLKILELSPNNLKIKVLPEQKPPIRLKTLELIARELAECYTGMEIVRFLKNTGVSEKLVVYPKSKWLIFYDIFEELSASNDVKDKTLLYKIITEAVHPINLNGNETKSNELVEKFNDYLRYDSTDYISFDEKERTYKFYFIPDEEERDQIVAEWDKDIEGKNEKQLKFLCQSENKEKISLLRKAFQSLMNVVEVFCENPSTPTPELNNAYQFLNKLVWDNIRNLKLREKESVRHFNNYVSPFTNLFAAEKHYKEQKRELSWQKIRPEMNAVYGDIEDLYREVNGSDILAEPDKQKELNEIQLHLSLLKKKKEMANKMQTKGRTIQSSPMTMPTAKIEITKMPELVIKSPDKFIGKKSDQNQSVELYLNNIGDLFRENKNKYCYPMGEESDRHKIVRFLTTNKGYSQTSIISSELNGKSEQSIRTEIGKINNNFQEFIKPKPKNSLLIEGRKGSGYRINPQHKIIIRNK